MILFSLLPGKNDLPSPSTINGRAKIFSKSIQRTPMDHIERFLNIRLFKKWLLFIKCFLTGYNFSYIFPTLIITFLLAAKIQCNLVRRLFLRTIMWVINSHQWITVSIRNAIYSKT